MLLHRTAGDEGLAAEDTAEQERTMRFWLEDTISRGVSLHGGRLEPPGSAATVRVRGGELLVTDGPFAETKEQIAGYDVIECTDLDEAIALALASPCGSEASRSVPSWTATRCCPATPAGRRMGSEDEPGRR